MLISNINVLVDGKKAATGREQQWSTCLIESVNTKNIEENNLKNP